MFALAKQASDGGGTLQRQADVCQQAMPSRVASRDFQGNKVEGGAVRISTYLCEFVPQEANGHAALADATATHHADVVRVAG